MVPWPWVALGLAAVAAAWLSADGAADIDTSGLNQLGPNLWAKPGVLARRRQLDFAQQMADRLGWPLVVTSGTRTAEAQAQALKAKRDRGEDLTQLYRRGEGPAIVAELLAAPNEVEPMRAIVQRWADRGVFMSRHMRGDAIDLRTRGYTSGQVQRMARVAEALGARALIESNHLHLEGL